MNEDQIIRLWLSLGGISLILLFVGALTNRITVYRDYHDLGWSVSFIISPLVGFMIVSFIAGDNVDLIIFIKEVTVGQIIFTLSVIATLWSAIKTIMNSINDNGILLGTFVGIAKLFIAILITFCTIGLINYLFKDKRKLGHIAIFFILFAVFGWFLNSLVNGEKTGTAN